MAYKSKIALCLAVQRHPGISSNSSSIAAIISVVSVIWTYRICRCEHGESEAAPTMVGCDCSILRRCMRATVLASSIVVENDTVESRPLCIDYSFGVQPVTSSSLRVTLSRCSR